MRKIFLLFFFLFLISFVSSSCTEGQIDINSATAEEIDSLYGIGTVKAEAIISSRPFSTVDDLINVSGIGEVTLEKINEQGLACVADENDIQESDNDTNVTDNTKNNENEVIDSKEVDTNTNAKENKNIENNEITLLSVKEIDTSPVSLTPKDIKTLSAPESTGSEVYPRYLLVVFCVLLLLLYLIKPKEKKNEFKR